MLRRAVFISGGRQFDPPPGLTAAGQGPARQGVCFNYQLPQAETSTRTPDWRTDFSTSARGRWRGSMPSWRRWGRM